jgi:type I restriction enzyme S subunit
LAEQRRIASILDKAEALRAKRREVQLKLDSFVNSLFASMFCDVTLPFLPLVEILKAPLQNGAYFPKESYEGKGIEMVHMSDAFYGTVTRGTLKRVRCTKEDIEKYQLTENDLLIARRSLNYDGAGKPCLIPSSIEPLIFESSFIRLTPDPSKVMVHYLFHYLSNRRIREQHIQRYITQSTISGINQANLSQIPVTIPPLELQKNFAARLLRLNAAKETSFSSQERLNGLFASLQHRAFRGEL